jgi:Tfp pilus assembly protein PilN
MITINLLPEEFKVKEKKQLNIPALKIFIVAGAIFGIVTLFFYVDFWQAKFALSRLNKEWLVVEPQSQRLKQLQQDVENNLTPENVFLKRFVTSDRPLTFILGWVNDNLPPTGWLTQLQMDRAGESGKLLVKGLTLPSKEKSSIEHIEIFLNALKQKMPDATLSLTTSRQKIKDVEVTQFTATFEWGMTAPGAKP